MNFEGKAAIVTGGALGIGYAVAEGFLKGGARVAIIDLNAEGLKKAEAELSKLGEVRTYVCDVSDMDRVNEVIKDVASTLGAPDILVNNAGIFNTYGSFVESDPEKWKQKINVNILGTMYPTKAVLPYMLEKKYGRIVNVGSVAGVYGIGHMVDYSMTKGAVISFTYALAKDVTEHGITVNCVSPGMIISASAPEHGEIQQNYIKRQGTSEECAVVIRFLCSEEAGYVSGQNYTVDGCRRII